jgi:acyl dehydratase
MAVDYETLMALELPNHVQRYDRRDAILYALGIGFGQDPLDRGELSFVVEGALKVMPTFALVLGVPPNWVRESGLDYARVVHGEQSAIFHAPLAPEGEVEGTLTITDVIDKGEGRGALVHAERVLTDRVTGTKLATLRQTIFARGDGGIGGPKGAQPPIHAPPDRAPDGTCSLPTVPQQALIYRLSGDYNPLHADPDAAEKVGFPRPILHGLATYGVAAHALLKSLCGYDPAGLRSISGRFTAPVYPGETLDTDYWCDGEVVSFRTRVAGRDVVAISNGKAIIGT